MFRIVKVYVWSLVNHNRGQCVLCVVFALGVAETLAMVVGQ